MSCNDWGTRARRPRLRARCARRHLLIEDLETGDVMMPLIDLKPVFHANYSRKVSALKNRQVDAPPGSELLAARPPGCTLYWQWALEAPPEVKDVIRHELGAENMSSVRAQDRHIVRAPWERAGCVVGILGVGWRLGRRLSHEVPCRHSPREPCAR